ncbi:MAG: SciE type virulence protein [Planctomycetia bacterium]|nr:SciE type virulence protein [Planctomycetia bacterium]
MTAKQLFESGKLADAVSAANDEVKKKPLDASCRWLLCELLCFAGDLERADKQLDLIGTQDPQAVAGVALFRQLVRAETARQEFFRDGRVPELLGAPDPILKAHIAASIELRSGNQSRAAELLAQARDAAPPAPGTCDGAPFDDLRDLDDLCGPFLEVLTSTGKYYWVPFSTIENLEFRPPKRPRDLIWRQTEISVNGGPNGEVFIPCLYAGAATHADDQIRLGRATDWVGDGPVRGVGQRMLLVGEADKSILEITKVDFTNSRNIGEATAQPAP